VRQFEGSMIVAVILSLLGLILIYLEFFLPGQIFAIGGTLLLLSSLFLLIIEKVKLVYFILFAIILFLVVFFTIKHALKRIKSNKGIFLDSDQEGFKASVFENDLIGHVGVAFTDLRPAGKVCLNEKYYLAICKEKFIEKGTKIQVIDGEGPNLIVREVM